MNISTPEHPIPSRRLRFGLRTLFMVVVIASIPCAWVGYSLNWIGERHDARSEGAYINKEVFVHDPFAVDHPRAPGGLWLFGEDGVDHIVLFSVDGPRIEQIRSLFPEAKIEESKLPMNPGIF